MITYLFYYEVMIYYLFRWIATNRAEHLLYIKGNILKYFLTPFYAGWTKGGM